VPTATNTPLPTSTNTPVPTATNTHTPTQPHTPTPTWTRTWTDTAVPTAANTATPMSTATPTLTPVPAGLSLPQNAIVAGGDELLLPLRISGLSGSLEFELSIHVDPEIVQLLDVKAGELVDGPTFSWQQDEFGDVSLSGVASNPFGSNPGLKVSGSLANLRVRGVGACDETATLLVSDCLLAGGEMPCNIIEGALRIQCGLLSGSISHEGSFAPVPGTTVQLLGNDGLTVETNSLGQFGFDGLDDGLWTVEPVKSGGVGSAITSMDASYIMQFLAEWMELTAEQQIACDVTGNGYLSTLDAKHILRKAVHRGQQLNVAKDCGSDWAFFPQPAEARNQFVTQPGVDASGCRRGAISFDPLAGEALNQNFAAMPYGDCSGNWSDEAAATAAVAAAVRRVRLGQPRVRRGTGRTVIPLYVESDEPFYALDLKIAISGDPIHTARARLAGAARGALVEVNSMDDGETIALSLASAEPIHSADEPLVYLVLDHRRRGTSTRRVGVSRADVDELMIYDAP
jgi:hypothetical protein